MNRSFLFPALAVIALICLGLLLAPQAFAFPEIYIVNTTFDANTGADDAFPGDGQCETAVGNGFCTLRAAIEETNAHAGSDGIFFDIPTTDPFYNNGTWTINLVKALPDVSDGVNITGPGVDKLVINGGNAFRVLNITSTGIVNLSHLTIANGNAASSNGGGIQNANTGTMNLTGCILSQNAAKNGGGIYNASTGTVNLNNSTLSGNSALGPSQVPLGGGIYNTSGTINVTNSTLISNVALRTSGSQAFGSGGGIYNAVNGKLNVFSSTFSDNSAAIAANINSTSGGGGAIANDAGTFGNTGAMNITNSTFYGNSGGSGGAIFKTGGF